MAIRPDTPIENLSSRLPLGARRAMAPLGVDLLSDLARRRRSELARNGAGAADLAAVEALLREAGLAFRPD
jgi:hypothetical protein